ncbi:prepilin-type N-terminal cleavage/methylation domain-containing protein [Halomonas sp. EGI 63088]|uniref:Prepilin-type N-terminal cleavage/methylation domain-containing protein n=1 Tax=Halomonas flagellata TaxID=2920385 RepID=A0ABS9RXF7_9GAMM|nr:prepilin-type N-terminal cleavage/methylation domain-containing protein [Halomonas flagellata]MCH4564494.1 prepilin-type N-terminal cleavage/methylation domain-containing protein [Halomonas flagellata]
MMALNRGLARQRGFTLVELMVALVIGLLVILGATQLFVSGRQALNRVEELTWRQSNLDYVAETLFREIRIANGQVAPVSGGGKVSSSANLLIEFDESSSGYDPYCGGDRLVGVEYFKLTDSDSLRMQVKCSSASEYDLYSAEGVEVIEGVRSLEFRGDITSGGSPYIEVDIGFSLMSGESSTTADVSYVVTNRKKVIESLN